MSKFKIQPWEQKQHDNYFNIDLQPPDQIISIKKLGQFNVKALKSCSRHKSKKSSRTKKCRKACCDASEHQNSLRKSSMEKQISTKRIEIQKTITQLKFAKELEEEYQGNKGMIKRPIKHRLSSSKNNNSIQKTFFPFGTTFCKSQKNLASKSLYSSKNIQKNHNLTQNCSLKNSRVFRKSEKKLNFINMKIQEVQYSHQNKPMQKTLTNFSQQLSIERKIYLMKSGGIEKFTDGKKLKISKLAEHINLKTDNKASANFKNLIGKIYPKQQSQSKLFVKIDKSHNNFL